MVVKNVMFIPWKAEILAQIDCPLAAGKSPSVAEGSNCIPHHRLFMILFHCRRVH